MTKSFALLAGAATPPAAAIELFGPKLSRAIVEVVKRASARRLHRHVDTFRTSRRISLSDEHNENRSRK